MGALPPHSAAMQDVRLMCARLAHPLWMPEPASWTWRRPDGLGQGFATLAPRKPGLANLLWLSLDKDRPPLAYDATLNGLFSILLGAAGTARLLGEPLQDVAALLPLREFALALPALPPASRNAAELAYPLLRVLAERRLRC